MYMYKYCVPGIGIITIDIFISNLLSDATILWTK